MGNGDVHPWSIGQERVMNSIAGSLNRIANLLEGFESRERQRLADIDPDSLGAHALWREAVARDNCLLGFADWRAWHESDKAEAEAEAAEHPPRPDIAEGL